MAAAAVAVLVLILSSAVLDVAKQCKEFSSDDENRRKAKGGGVRSAFRSVF
jgi:hypothetical protein